MTVPASIVAQDQHDPLAVYRQHFELAKDIIYLDGNSLGPVCKPAIESLNRVQLQWQNDLIKSWNQHQWIDLPHIVGEKIAPLIGAATEQTICCDSVSINLFKLVAAALSLQPNRFVVLSERDNFPTDLYMLEGLQSLLGKKDLEIRLVDADEIEAQLDESVAVLLLTQVNFKTGCKHDMAILNDKAKKAGALTLWDLSHSVGAFPIELDKTGADFAVGCGYKYLNGGPGAPAFIYAAKRHHDVLQQPLSGWTGHAKPFAFDQSYQPAQGVGQFLSGTPSILAMASLSGALDLFSDIDLATVEEKSRHLQTTFLKALENESKHFELVTSMNQAHGSQLSLAHSAAYEIAQNMIAENAIVDFREPNILRIGFAPLYLSYQQSWQAGAMLSGIMQSKSYQSSKFRVRGKVT